MRSRRGSEVIELALLLLPLLWLTFGAIDFGWYFYLQHNLEGAAREGARAGIISPTADVNGAVARIMSNAGFKDSSVYTVDVQSAALEVPGDGIKVTVTMNYSAMGIPPARVQKTTVAGEATMRKEY
jgi:Flp pilus assembly protein TadG